MNDGTVGITTPPAFPGPVADLRVKPNRHHPFLARHPWVHAHALIDTGDDLACGDVVTLTDHDGNWLGIGLVNPLSKLRVRLFSFRSDTALDESLIRQRLEHALARRNPGSRQTSDALRLVFSESDLLSGLIVDRYADCLSVQFTSGALFRYSEVILSQLIELTEASYVKVTLDQRTARYESVDPIDRWHEGQSPPNPVSYRQNGLKFSLDLETGQKTGGYLDQRDNHALAAEYLVGRRVLDVCCYHGGFGLVARMAGAISVLGIDSSQQALDLAAENAKQNDLSGVEFSREDCFDALKSRVSDGQQFDAVILDPPRFAGSRREVDAALRAYTRLNAWAVDLLPPGGILVTCSCSGRVTRADFFEMLTIVGKKRRRDLIILENRGPASDHPVAASCPESDYLKCVIAEVR